MIPVVARSFGVCRKEGYEEIGNRARGCGGESSRYRDGSCANDVSWRCTWGCQSMSKQCLVLVWDQAMAEGIVDLATGVPYLIVLFVLRRIHWGMGRFCFCARASFCLVRKDFWLCSDCQINSGTLFERRGGISYRHRDGLTAVSDVECGCRWAGVILMSRLAWCVTPSTALLTKSFLVG
jgi:hypothetical protein